MYVHKQPYCKERKGYAHARKNYHSLANKQMSERRLIRIQYKKYYDDVVAVSYYFNCDRLITAHNIILIIKVKK